VEVTTLTTGGENTLLAGLRHALGDADELLACVAFVHSQGVHLIQPQLQALGSNGRLLLTTTFATSTAPIVKARALGLNVAVLNPPSGTYHPKVYVARRGDAATAIVGLGQPHRWARQQRRGRRDASRPHRRPADP
jgi:HKD family nuclease